MTKYEKNDYFILLFFISKKDRQITYPKNFAKNFHTPLGRRFVSRKTSKFYMPEHGIFEKDFLLPKYNATFLIPPWGQEWLSENTKILPLLTRDFLVVP